MNNLDWGKFDYGYEHDQYVRDRRVKIIGVIILATAVAAYVCDFRGLRTAYPTDISNTVHRIAND